jgi:hypothetical protein
MYLVRVMVDTRLNFWPKIWSYVYLVYDRFCKQSKSETKLFIHESIENFFLYLAHIKRALKKNPIISCDGEYLGSDSFFLHINGFQSCFRHYDHALKYFTTYGSIENFKPYNFAIDHIFWFQSLETVDVFFYYHIKSCFQKNMKFSGFQSLKMSFSDISFHFYLDAYSFKLRYW